MPYLTLYMEDTSGTTGVQAVQTSPFQRLPHIGCNYRGFSSLTIGTFTKNINDLIQTDGPLN
jgi:hypothetical protein